MKKILIIILITFVLVFGCKKKTSNTIDTTLYFENGVIIKDTHIYRTAKLKGYVQSIKRGQLILLSNEIKTFKKGNLTYSLVKCKVPGSDKIYWLVEKIIIKKYKIVTRYIGNRIIKKRIKNDFIIACTHLGIRKIMIVNVDTYFYDKPNHLSKRKNILAGVKVILLEQGSIWHKVSIQKGRRVFTGWIQRNELSTDNSDVSIKVNIPNLGMANIETSSNYSSYIGNERDYSGDRAVDGNRNTSWQEGADELGINEWIKINFKNEVKSYKLEILNGYSKNEEAYLNNGRPKKIRIETDSQNIVKELNDSFSIFQELGVFKGSFLKITILEVYPGAKYKDTAISELKFTPIEETDQSQPSTNENSSQTSEAQ